MVLPRHDPMNLRIVEENFANRWMRLEECDKSGGASAVVSLVLPPHASMLAIKSERTDIDLHAVLMRGVFRIFHAVCTANVLNSKLTLVCRLPLVLNPEKKR